MPSHRALRSLWCSHWCCYLPWYCGLLQQLLLLVLLVVLPLTLLLVSCLLLWFICPQPHLRHFSWTCGYNCCIGCHDWVGAGRSAPYGGGRGAFDFLLLQ